MFKNKFNHIPLGNGMPSPIFDVASFVEKYNSLADKYNALEKEHNELIAKEDERKTMAKNIQIDYESEYYRLQEEICRLKEENKGLKSAVIKLALIEN